MAPLQFSEDVTLWIGGEPADFITGEAEAVQVEDSVTI